MNVSWPPKQAYGPVTSKGLAIRAAPVTTATTEVKSLVSKLSQKVFSKRPRRICKYRSSVSKSEPILRVVQTTPSLSSNIVTLSTSIEGGVV